VKRRSVQAEEIMMYCESNSYVFTNYNNIMQNRKPTAQRCSNIATQTIYGNFIHDETEDERRVRWKFFCFECSDERNLEYYPIVVPFTQSTTS